MKMGKSWIHSKTVYVKNQTLPVQNLFGINNIRIFVTNWMFAYRGGYHIRLDKSILCLKQKILEFMPSWHRSFSLQSPNLIGNEITWTMNIWLTMLLRQVMISQSSDCYYYPLFNKTTANVNFCTKVYYSIL